MIEDALATSRFLLANNLPFQAFESTIGALEVWAIGYNVNAAGVVKILDAAIDCLERKEWQNDFLETRSHRPVDFRSIINLIDGLPDMFYGARFRMKNILKIYHYQIHLDPVIDNWLLLTHGQHDQVF